MLRNAQRFIPPPLAAILKKEKPKINLIIMKTIILFSLLIAIGLTASSQELQLMPFNTVHNIEGIFDLALDKSDNLWVATDKGLLKHNGTTWINQVPGYTSKIYIDSQNRKWFTYSWIKSTSAGSHIGGLNMLDNSNKVITDFDDVIKSRIINDICEDNNGKILVATGDKDRRRATPI